MSSLLFAELGCSDGEPAGASVNRVRLVSGEGVLRAAMKLLRQAGCAVLCCMQAWRARPRIVVLVLLRPAARQNALAHGL
ncbi:MULTISPECIES: hypothetical protein [Xanthomonas]|uniref:hypothetical protein n=1 Tax=Xanthomonas TaxID=338 RepID=UPI001EE86558|nr:MULTISPECIES: hypothetical protein [Xanthomonas]MEA9565227.1 hypothetical protein [Xanthomonas sp. WHRI 8932A]